MNLLILGGTRFLGRHAVEAARARGHDVTIFTRGRIPVPWPDGVRHLVGDRDPLLAPGLASLSGKAWDAAIDLSGYVPRCVRASAQALAGRVPHCVFVSSLSVYADGLGPGQDESAPVAALADPATEDVMAHYGALKAACEREVAAAFGEVRAALVRPGLIVGPHDPTDRFSYWVARFVAPALLNDRGDAAVVPAPPTRPVQFIDARDLAAFLVDLAEGQVAGVFNACSEAGQWTMGDLIATLVDSAGRRHGRPPLPVWIDEAALLAAGVEPWTGLPLWVPSNDPAMSGFLEFDCQRAHAAGLAERPLAETVDDTAQWLATRHNAGVWGKVISGAAERAQAHAVVDAR